MQLSGQLSSKGHARLKAIVAATFPVHSGGGGAAAAAAIDDDDDDAKVDTDTKVENDTKVDNDTKVETDTKVLQDKVNECKDDDEWKGDDEVRKRICITKARDNDHWVRDRVQAVLSHPPNKGDLRCVV